MANGVLPGRRHRDLSESILRTTLGSPSTAVRSTCVDIPFMPDRIIDNLLAKDVKLSVAPWAKIDGKADNLSLLRDNAAAARAQNRYDLSAPMRRANS